MWNGYRRVRSGVVVVHTSIHTDTNVGVHVHMSAGWDGLAYSY